VLRASNSDQLPQQVDIAIIGGGQAGLSVGYFLKKAGLSFIILDAEVNSGGSRQHAWDSLRLFSPADYSSMPGWQFPATSEKYPSRDDTIEYLTEYERRYSLPVYRGVSVRSVRRAGGALSLETAGANVNAKAVVSCTGTWGSPFIPAWDGLAKFKGIQLHSGHYKNAETFLGQHVLVIGGGNSGAQIMADLIGIGVKSTWVTKQDPIFLPSDVDGRALFQLASKRYEAHLRGETEAIPSLADIVMVKPVKEAFERGELVSKRPFETFTERGIRWQSREEDFDAVIWCTGFRPNLSHLDPLGIVGANGEVVVVNMRAVAEPRLWLRGYGDWTGFGSATIFGGQRYARSLSEAIVSFLKNE
jgi:putative flavoprotein involved in K+ transport